jgi:hypothetical protein
MVSNCATTLFISGRFEGLAWTIVSTNGRMKSNPRFTWTASAFSTLTRRSGITNLDEVLPYYIAEIVDIGWERIAACIKVFVFRY